MNLMNTLLGKQILVMISGVIQPLEGALIDIGQDVIVIKNQLNYLYIPTAHIKFVRDNVDAVPEPHEDSPISITAPAAQEILSLQTILENGKGIFTEICITGVHTLHGYIQNILSDYLVFHSLVFGTVLVNMKHLKYLHPYLPEIAPYSLTKDQLQLNLPAAVSTEPNFIQQLKAMEGNFIVIDLADQPQKVGLLKTVQTPMIELVTPNGESIFSLIEHIQTVNHV